MRVLPGTLSLTDEMLGAKGRDMQCLRHNLSSSNNHVAGVKHVKHGLVKP